MFNDIAIVDADSIYFRVACVTQKQNEIRKAIKHTMTEIRRNTGTDSMLIAVKGHGNFRNEIYPKYKANRKELDPKIKKALQYGHQYMVDYYGAIMANGMEADDLVSIWTAEQRDMDRSTIVVGIDKDLLQIPGWHYNFVKKTSQEVDMDKANLNLMLQCLTGDTADNIPGIRGIGPKKAAAILSGVPMQRRWNRVRASWRGHKAGDPTTSRRLLEMLTSWKEYDNLRNQLDSKTTQCKQDVLEGEESKDEGISRLPE